MAGGQSGRSRLKQRRIEPRSITELASVGGLQRPRCTTLLPTPSALVVFWSRPHLVRFGQAHTGHSHMAEKPQESRPNEMPLCFSDAVPHDVLKANRTNGAMIVD